MPVLTDEEVGIGELLSDADVGIAAELSPAPRLTDRPNLTAPIKPVGSSEELAAQNFYAQQALLGRPPPTPGEQRGVGQLMFEPIKELTTKLSGQTVADALDVIKAYATQNEDLIAALGEKSREPTTAEKVFAGTQTAVGEAIDSFTSPVGAFTLGIGLLPKAVQTGVAAVFAAHMGSQLPGQLEAGVEAIKAGDPESASKHLGGAALGATFTGLAGRQAVQGIREVLPRTSAAALKRVPSEKAQKEAEILAPETGKEPIPAAAVPEPVVPTATAPVETPKPIPEFAKRFNQETLLAKPSWVEIGTGLDRALDTTRLNPEQGVDITPAWKSLTSSQRQELMARGWVVRDTRVPGQVVLGVSNDAITAKKYFSAQLTQSFRQAGKEPTAAPQALPPETTAPATTTGEIKSPAAAEPPVAAEPSTRISTTPVEITQEAIRAGPGAATPVEFEQRIRERPPEGPPPEVIESGQPIIEPLQRRPADYNIANKLNSPQAVFSSGKLGESAKQAWETMALGEFEMRESIARDVQQYVENTMGTLPRKMRKEGGKAFFDVLDGKGIEEIETAWQGRAGADQVIPAARAIKTRLEEIRTNIRDIKRENYGKYLSGLDNATISELFRDNISTDYVPQNRSQMVDALVLNSFPDDWGIADGSYLPHLFFGNWKVTAQQGDRVRFVTRVKTPEEAKVAIRQMAKDNPDFANATFKVEQDTVIPSDMVRLFDKRFFSLINEMRKATDLTPSEIKQAQQGIIGRKAAKQKWFGSLQKREGFQGYSKDFERVLTAYLSGFHRWRVLSRVQNETIPLIENVKFEGRYNAATRLEGLMENLWGKPAESTLQFDAALQRFPWLRDKVEPLALDRWSRAVRNVAAFAHLTNPRYFAINRLQPLQGLYPIVGERLLGRAKVLQHSAEGQRLLDQYGVKFDIGQFGETGLRGPISKFRERITGENSNQELAFLAMYLHGTERGMTPAQAAQYAKLRGQLFTQFSPLTVDIPQAFEGPVAQSVFQYKRFTVKQLELLGNLAKSGNLSGIGRMLATLGLIGGGNYFLRQFYVPSDERLRFRKTLVEQFGEDGADYVLYGLPGLLHADLSGSLILGDQPRGNIYETIGRATTGPAISSAIDVISTITTDERESMSAMEKAQAAMRRIPALKPISEAIDLFQQDFDVTTPDGETRYKRALKDILVGLGAFRSKNESKIQTAIDAIYELKKETQGLKNDYFLGLQNGNTADALAAIDKFNERWPEAAITDKELVRYIRYRRTASKKTDVERIGGRKYIDLIPATE